MNAAHIKGGFNLLPWRPREMRRQRRRRVIEWCAAALLGCVCAAPLAGWQLWQRSRLDARGAAIEQSMAQLRAPLAEAQRLLGAAAARRAAEQEAQQRGKPLTRTLALLDALSAAGSNGIALRKVAQHGEETEVDALAATEAATAEWIGRLREVPDIEKVSVRELKRAGQGAHSARNASDGEPIHVIATLTWRGAASTKQSADSKTRTKVRNR